MNPAQYRLEPDLVALMFSETAMPVVTNVDARATTAPDELRDALVRQVSAPVRWIDSMQLLIEQGVGTFVETGPGKVLSGLMRQTSRDVKTLNVEDAASLEATHSALVARIE
jgi:[acyl-carrier-protein] S-malonyltransferase